MYHILFVYSSVTVIIHQAEKVANLCLLSWLISIQQSS